MCLWSADDHGDRGARFARPKVLHDNTVLPGAVHAAGNMAPEKARVFVTFLLPEGAQLTTVVSAAESPVQVASGDPWWAEAETLGCAASASVCCDRPMIGGPAVC